MSSEFSSEVIQRDIDAKKAKLEALKQRRLARQHAEAQAQNRSGAISPINESEANSGETSFASESAGDVSLAASLNTSLPAILDTASLPASLNVSLMLDDSVSESLDDSLISSSIPKKRASAGVPSSSRPSAIVMAPPSKNKKPQMRRFSTMRLADSKVTTAQLEAIRQSFQEIAQHSAEVAPPLSATHKKRVSFGPIDFSPPRTSASSALAAPPSPSPMSPIAPIAEAVESAASTAGHMSPPGGASLNGSAFGSPIAAGAASSAGAFSDVAADAPSDQSAVIDELLAQIQSLSESIRSKNDDLQMAGDLGSVLLQNNEEANKRIEELQTAVESQEQDIYALKDEVRSSERKAKKLQLHLNERDGVVHELESEMEIVKMELELERQNKRALEAELVKARSDHSDADDLAELTTQMAELKQAHAKAEAQLAEARRARDDTDEAFRNLKEEHEEALRDLAQAEKYEVKTHELQEQIAILKAQDTVNVLAELQWENQRLVNALHELTTHYDILQESNARDQELLKNLQMQLRNGEPDLNDSRSVHRMSRVGQFESLADDEVLDDGASMAGDDFTSAVEIIDEHEEEETMSSTNTSITSATATATSTAAATAATGHRRQPSASGPKRDIELREMSPPVHSPIITVTAPVAPLTPGRSSAPATPRATNLSSTMVEEEDPTIRAANAAAAAMYMATSTPGRRISRSSLANGSASLAYANATSALALSSSVPVISPLRPSMNAFMSSLSTSPARPPQTTSALSAALSMHRSSNSQSGIGSFTNASATTAATAAGMHARRRSSVGRWSLDRSGSFAGAGGLTASRAVPIDPNMRLVQYPTPQSMTPRVGGIWDEEELDDAAFGDDRTSSHSSSFVGRKAGERDADWEFFALTLLCVKIHSARKMESLYTISTQDLWVKAKEENIPFHSYYAWLEEQMTRAYVQKLLCAAQRDASQGPPPVGHLVLDSHVPSNSAVSLTPKRATLNTAATRVQLQTPTATSPNLPGTAAAVRVITQEEMQATIDAAAAATATTTSTAETVVSPPTIQQELVDAQ